MPVSKNQRATITFPLDDSWVLETLETLVRRKQAMGLNTNVSREAVRMLKNQILGTVEGQALDRQLLPVVNNAHT